MENELINAIKDVYSFGAITKEAKEHYELKKSDSHSNDRSKNEARDNYVNSESDFRTSVSLIVKMIENKKIDFEKIKNLDVELGDKKYNIVNALIEIDNKNINKYLEANSVVLNNGIMDKILENIKRFRMADPKVSLDDLEYRENHKKFGKK